MIMLERLTQHFFNVPSSDWDLLFHYATDITSEFKFLLCQTSRAVDYSNAPPYFTSGL